MVLDTESLSNIEKYQLGEALVEIPAVNEMNGFLECRHFIEVFNWMEPEKYMK